MYHTHEYWELLAKQLYPRYENIRISDGESGCWEIFHIRDIIELRNKSNFRPEEENLLEDNRWNPLTKRSLVLYNNIIRLLWMWFPLGVWLHWLWSWTIVNYLTANMFFSLTSLTPILQIVFETCHSCPRWWSKTLRHVPEVEVVGDHRVVSNQGVRLKWQCLGKFSLKKHL